MQKIAVIPTTHNAYSAEDVALPIEQMIEALQQMQDEGIEAVALNAGGRLGASWWAMTPDLETLEQFEDDSDRW